ncbi:hypothetical protein G7Y89_g5545 [Cudoniella acicularis]|uniref:Dicer-like protein 1 n=1 Tax=Cudoniella acicularis TaxID=354080 RepID=A0A8H4RN42_9HELO|nr:hypothetical protein G7Y89_g5545 [Cudoniella acicularis]
MSYFGYLQDLSLLQSDCLLPHLNVEKALISHTPPEPSPCSPELSPDTLEAMMLLDQNAILYEASKADEKAESTTSITPRFAPPTSSPLPFEERVGFWISQTENIPPSTFSSPLLPPTLTPLARKSVNINKMSLPIVEQPRSPPASITNSSFAAPPPLARLSHNGRPSTMSQLTVAAAVVASRVTNAVMPDQAHPNTTSDEQLNINSSTINQQASLPTQHLVTATALATRTNEEVIADLKRDAHAPAGPVNKSTLDGEDDDANDDGYRSLGDDDEYDGTQPAGRPKKISERKRRLHAIAQNHLEALLRNPVKQPKVKPEDEQFQSARWLVNQSENRKIITSPREYQVELFERAKQKNIIAVLDTGSGKTLIAVLLLRHTFAQELEDRAVGKPKRISFFLVDSVTLVYQQHAVLKANLDQPMDLFCGDMGVSLWKRKKWEEIFDKNMVIACTAEVLRQCLHHSFISIDQINLLIFDEAHHAKKDHAYARIIKDFYAQAPSTSPLPKIFGMTASPVDAKTDVRKAAAELEAILHCEIATAADPSVFQFQLTSKQEVLATYSNLGPQFVTPLFKQMESKFKKNKILSKPLAFAREAARELGEWCADQIWTFCLSEDELKKLLVKTETKYYANAAKVQKPIEIMEQQKASLVEAQNIVKSHTFALPDFNPRSATSKNLSSKVRLLVSYLRERFERPTEDKCIVFVKQRYTARILAELFSHSNIKTPHLFVGVLVGTRTGVVGGDNTSLRTQIVTMAKFRGGELNCLFATSVAEEGLDIPDCNLIVRFDLYDTLIQYIQSRGRARHANSRYVHMCEAGNQEHVQMLREVRLKEGILKEFCTALPEDRKMYGNDIDMDHFLAKERTHRVFKHPATGAILNYKVSLTVLANYVDSLPSTAAQESLRAEYVHTVHNKQFLCEVILPEESPIRGAVGRPASTKQIAKCSAAFETCLLLIKGKYLNERLLPKESKAPPAMRNALLAVDSKKEAYDMKTKPSLWSLGGIPGELFVTILSLENPESLDRLSQPLALLTRSKLPELPSFVLHFGKGKYSPIQIKTANHPIQATLSMVNQVNAFTLCIFDDVFSKGYEPDISKMPYFLAPVHPNLDLGQNPFDLIAWDLLKDIEEYQVTWQDKGWEKIKPWLTEPDEFFEDKFIIDPFDGSRKLWCRGVTREYKPLDPVPPNTAPRKGTRKRNDNIMEYSCSLWDKARQRRKLDENQRVFNAELVSLRRNLLDEFNDQEDETPKKCYVTLETLKVSPLPTTVVAMAYLFPAVIRRLESYLIALEACDLLHLKIRPDLALEAVTKDSDNSGDHDAVKINFQRGMGNNYERLEFLGDCFLKMATSISLYGIHPDNDEYRYHVDRMLLICNKNLCNNAVKLKLYEYIRSQQFNRRAWYPEGLTLIKGKTATAPNTHKLGDKSIADVCEALIGAALETCYESKEMDNAVRAVTEIVSSENHNVTSYADYYQLYKKPKWQTAPCTEMQRDLARQVEMQHPYHFKWPRLLRSAFVHPSYPFSYEHIPSYQRLEFLGDSLLDMACVNYLFHAYPGKDPQWLTEHKMAMVSNAFLGCLCVSLGFHTHLLVFNSTFQKQITTYVAEIEEARRQAEDDAIRAGKTRAEYSSDYWVSVRNPPKSLPDIVEAYIGALFVDSEYNYSEVEKFFDDHIKWYFTDMSIYDSYANKHPTTFLSNLLSINMGCEYWTILTKEIKNVDGSKPTIFSMVIIHDQVVADGRAESSRYSKVAAAKKAMDLLEGLPLPEFREKYCCTCKPGDVVGVDTTELHGTAI